MSSTKDTKEEVNKESKSTLDLEAAPIQIFVGGISPLVDEETFRQYFIKYGKLLECRLMLDKDTKKSRGFGFITFANRSDTEKVLNRKMMLLGKEIECKNALSKHESKLHVSDEKSRKIFVGGLPQDLRDYELREYFVKFGPIKTARIIYEHDSKTSRGFGFIIFKNRYSVDEVLARKKEHFLKDKWIDCKPALLREEIKAMKPSDAGSFEGSESPSKQKKSLMIPFNNNDSVNGSIHSGMQHFQAQSPSNRPALMSRPHMYPPQIPPRVNPHHPPYDNYRPYPPQMRHGAPPNQQQLPIGHSPRAYAGGYDYEHPPNRRMPPNPYYSGGYYTPQANFYRHRQRNYGHRGQKNPNMPLPQREQYHHTSYTPKESRQRYSGGGGFSGFMKQTMENMDYEANSPRHSKKLSFGESVSRFSQMAQQTPEEIKEDLQDESQEEPEEEHDEIDEVPEE